MADSKERANAERSFLSARRPSQKEPRARSEQEEKKQASDEKTARLRSLRLGKEAEDKRAVEAEEATPSKKRLRKQPE
jgi:hypothetical protein